MKLFTKSDAGLLPAARLRKMNLAAFANLPRAYKPPSRGLPEPSAVQRRLGELAHLPARQLEDACHLLAGQNLLRLRPDAREAQSRQILQIVYPVIARIYDKYQASPTSLPEGGERRELLTAAIAVTEQLAIAWKHLFRETYSTDLRRYRKQQAVIREYALRVLEMLLLEQRLRALRYQKLPRNAWMDANRIFFAMALHDDVTTPLRLTGVAGLRQRTAGQAGPQTTVASIQRLYLSLQLFGVLDASSWPTNLFVVPDAYLDSLDTGIVLRRDDGEALAPGTLLTWVDHDGPPVFERPETLTAPALVLDYTAYYNRLVQDYEAIAKMKFIDAFDPRQISAPLRRVDDEDRVPVLQLMLSGLRKRERRARRHAVFDENRIPVWFGLGEVAALLREQAPAVLQARLRSRDLREAMAQASKLAIGEERHEPVAHWQILNFSAGGILISALEGEFGLPIALGQLVAFQPSPDAETLAVGFVCRLNRPQDRVVEVGITRLATAAEMAIIEGPTVEGEPFRLPAILLHEQNGEWQILCEPDDRLQPGLPVKLYRGEKPEPARFGELRLSKKEFNLYAFRSPTLHRPPA